VGVEYIGAGGNLLPGRGPECTPEPGDGAPTSRTSERGRNRIARGEIVLEGVKPHPVHWNTVELALTGAIARRHHPNGNASAHQGAGQCTERGAGKVT
jgi:hypothetical protein